jgi:hypothetical protein
MRGEQRAGDGQAQAGAAVGAPAGEKGLEDARAIGFRNAGAVVSDRQQDLAVRAP